MKQNGFSLLLVTNNWVFVPQPSGPDDDLHQVCIWGQAGGGGVVLLFKIAWKWGLEGGGENSGHRAIQDMGVK